MTGKRAFVTGATGFLGLNLVEQLTDAGWRVSALYRPSSDLTYICRFPVEVVEGDLLDISELRAEAKEFIANQSLKLIWESEDYPLRDYYLIAHKKQSVLFEMLSGLLTERY